MQRSDRLDDHWRQADGIKMVFVRGYCMDNTGFVELCAAHKTLC